MQWEKTMLMEELYKYYGSWANMARQLDFGATTYLGWKKKGYIPWKTQCVIEAKTHRKFKAHKGHGNPNKRTTYPNKEF